MYQSQLEGLEVRCNLVLRALRFFYLSLGAFDASALYPPIKEIKDE